MDCLLRSFCSFLSFVGFCYEWEVKDMILMIQGVWLYVDRRRAGVVWCGVGGHSAFADHWWLVLIIVLKHELRQQKSKPEQEQKPSGSEDPF